MINLACELFYKFINLTPLITDIVVIIVQNVDQKRS